MPRLTTRQVDEIRSRYNASLKAKVRSEPPWMRRDDPTPARREPTNVSIQDLLRREREVSEMMDRLGLPRTEPAPKAAPKKRVVKRKPAAQPEPAKTAYDRLMGEDDF